MCTPVTSMRTKKKQRVMTSREANTKIAKNQQKPPKQPQTQNKEYFGTLHTVTEFPSPTRQTCESRSFQPYQASPSAKLEPFEQRI
ncbi:Hypothetical protein, putative [Bodo saltans]|uniref:Uncharacterized protein n=1 Tax=Bodo saltans TaxID=75058 RepID=A0A0S4IY85_BODSA|nr:Hypothetical protein, putative [Bodo saltans]|eukprot:CUF69476.1 Hypothetical protein, putative [Bodo saltans]